MAATTTTLAGVLIQRGRAAEALPLLDGAIAIERADAIVRAKLDPDHRDAVNARLALGDFRNARAGR